jgi:hypothetical protein
MQRKCVRTDRGPLKDDFGTYSGCPDSRPERDAEKVYPDRSGTVEGQYRDIFGMSRPERDVKEVYPDGSGTVEGRFWDIFGMSRPERDVEEVCPSDESRGGWTRDPCKRYSKMVDFFV